MMVKGPLRKCERFKDKRPEGLEPTECRSLRRLNRISELQHSEDMVWY